MNGLWCYHKGKWSKEYCENLLKRVGEDDYLHGSVGDGELNTEIRRSKVKFLHADNPLYKDVFDDLWLMALEANRSFFNIHITKLDFVQIGCYESTNKGEYKVHQDVFWLNKDPNIHRKLSCSIQLSDTDDYDGGDFEMPDLPCEHPPKDDLRIQGTSLFFPAFVNHKVTPVTRGKRYSLVAWFEGPKWR